MNPFDYLQDAFIWATNILVDLALWSYQHGMDWLGDGFNDLSDFTADAAGSFWSASKWWERVQDAIEDILSWSFIKLQIKSWLYRIEEVVAWWYGWASHVTDIIVSWWEGTIDSVKDLINAAVEGFEELKAEWDNFWTITWPEWVTSFDALKGEWDNFWTVTFPTLISFEWLDSWWNDRLLDIQELIDTAVLNLAPLFEGWQEVRENIVAFVSDPLEWLWGRFADWFLGPEE